MTIKVAAQADSSDPSGLVVRAAVAAYLARYKGLSRSHTDSDLRVFLSWCTDRHLDPLAVRRVDIELYVRWLQEVRRFKPSTVSRRLAVVAGFYRTAVIDAVLEHSPAEYVRRPRVPPESPTLGLSHLQFEALLPTARTSANLGAIADGPSTTQVARTVGISAASASQHAAILRSAGLITTHRTGPAVLHSLTPLGEHLLRAGRGM